MATLNEESGDDWSWAATIDAAAGELHNELAAQGE